MKKGNDEVIAGKIAFTPRSSCRPGGCPGFHLVRFPADLFGPNSQGGLDDLLGRSASAARLSRRGHSSSPKPSWYGESVGHYEDDTLAVDAIGLSDKTFVDGYRTPHTEKLHVVAGGWPTAGRSLKWTSRSMILYYEPWSGIQRYDRVERPLTEQICAENNQHLFEYHIPVADKPDFWAGGSCDK
jgi:hypothetical protein